MRIPISFYFMAMLAIALPAARGQDSVSVSSPSPFMPRFSVEYGFGSAGFFHTANEAMNVNGYVRRIGASVRVGPVAITGRQHKISFCDSEFLGPSYPCGKFEEWGVVAGLSSPRSFPLQVNGSIGVARMTGSYNEKVTCDPGWGGIISVPCYNHNKVHIRQNTLPVEVGFTGKVQSVAEIGFTVQSTLSGTYRYWGVTSALKLHLTRCLINMNKPGC